MPIFVQPISANHLNFQPDVTIKVTTTEDLADFAINSVCSAGSPTGGPCSLRAALSEAAFYDNLIVKIDLPPGTYKLTLAEPAYEDDFDYNFGDLDLIDADEGKGNLVVINGNGGPGNRSIIDADRIDRVLQIGKNRIVWLSNLVLKNGFVQDGNGSYGGGIYLSNANLLMDNVRLTNNKIAVADANVALGGAIHSDDSRMSIINCEFDHNKGNTRSTIDVYQSTVSNNKDSDLIYGTTFHHNVASSNSEYAVHLYYGKDLNFINSTMSDNIAGEGKKSGRNISSSDDLWIQHSTIIAKGSVNVWNRYSLRLYFSVLVNLPDNNGEKGQNCLKDVDYLPSKSGNVVTDDSCSPDLANGDVQAPYNQVGLMPLANYGGPTPTKAITANSPARDMRMGGCQYYDVHAGKGGGTDPVLTPLESDQRGFSRDDNFCDSGAYERQPYWLYMPLMTN